MTEVDVSPLVPEVREVAREAAACYLNHLGPWLRCLLIHGSAVKGGFIPYASDLDFQAYLEDSAFAEDGQVRLEASLAIQNELNQIELGIVSYVQCFPLRLQGRADWTPPVPGSYYVVSGNLPVAPATAEQLLDAAHARLSTMSALPFKTSDSLLDAGQGRLDRVVRLLSTDVWPTLYQVLTCLTDDPLTVWCLPKEQAIQLLPEGESPRSEIERFYAAVLERARQGKDAESSLEVLRRGVDFLRAAKAWYAGRPAGTTEHSAAGGMRGERERALLLLGCVVVSVLVVVIVLIGIITALHPHLF
jgi:hypothetical protein